MTTAGPAPSRWPARRLRFDQVGCVYYRRPSRFDLPDELAEPAWAAAEARMGLGGVLSTLPRWLNHPADMARATYIDGTIHAARVDANSPAARVDWRADTANITYTATELDADTAAGVRRLMNTLRLRLGALDLVVTPDGRTWFLEVNPNGQWAFVEDATGQPITATIADALLDHPET